LGLETQKKAEWGFRLFPSLPPSGGSLIILIQKIKVNENKRAGELKSGS